MRLAQRPCRYTTAWPLSQNSTAAEPSNQGNQVKTSHDGKVPGSVGGIRRLPERGELAGSQVTRDKAD